MAQHDVNRRGRRGLLRVALGVPALMAALQAGGATAHADDDGEGDDNRGRGRGRGRGQNEGIDGATFRSDLVPINQINTNDFNPGGSDTGFGTLSVGSAGGSSSVLVRVRGATPNVTYNVQFVPLNNSGARQQLGSFTTNSAGNGSVDLSGALNQSGSAAGNLGTRVGSFVLTRNDNGSLAFVTAA